MEITQNILALLKAAMTIAKNNGKHLPQFQALHVQRCMITAADFDMVLRIELAAPLAPQLGEQAFAMNLKTLHGALSINRKAITVETAGNGKDMLVNGIGFPIDDALRHGQEYSPRALGLDPARAKPAYEPADLSERFYANLERVRPAMAESDTRNYLNGLAFDFPRRRIIATNGHRMHLCNGETLPSAIALTHDDAGNAATPVMVLPREAAELIRSLKPKTVSTWLPVLEEGKTEIVRQPGFFVFSAGADADLTWELRVAEIEGTYPEVDRVIPPDYKMRRRIAVKMHQDRPHVTSVPAQVVIPNCSEAIDAFVKACKTAVSSKYDTAVVIDLNKGRLRNPKNIPVSIDKEVFLVPQTDSWIRPDSEHDTLCGINARYLSDGLKALGQNVTWDVDPAAVWRATDHGDLTVVIMPMRT